MIKLKMFFGLGLAVAIIMLCVFAPVKTMDRFVLPDGCCSACAESHESVFYACMCEDGKGCRGAREGSGRNI